MAKFKHLISILCCIVLISCNIDQPSSPSDNNYNQNGDNSSSKPNDGGSNTSSEEEFYFELELPASREISTDAGSTRIFFECNQKYIVYATGNISGLTISNTYGEGDGSVTVSFDKVQYDDSGSGISWNEHGYIIFHVKEGKKSNYREVKKEFHLYRQGSRMKP